MDVEATFIWLHIQNMMCISESQSGLAQKSNEKLSRWQKMLYIQNKHK